MKPENVEMLKNLIKETLEKMTFSDFTLGIREEGDPDGENTVFNIEHKGIRSPYWPVRGEPAGSSAHIASFGASQDRGQIEIFSGRQ